MDTYKGGVRTTCPSACSSVPLLPFYSPTWSLHGGQAAVALQWASITALPAAAGPLSHCPNPTPSPSLHCREERRRARHAAPQQTASAAAICLQLHGCRVSSGEEIKKINSAVILISPKMRHACGQRYMFYIHIHTVYYIIMDIFSCTP